MADNAQFTSTSRRGGTSGSTAMGESSGADSAERIIESAKNVGSQMIGAVQDTATSLLDEQRGRAADQIASIAGMVRNSVQSLDRQNAGAICQYADDTARQIDDFADRLRNRSWGQLAGDVEDFARRWPGVFMASAAAAGFIAGRFLVASGSRARETQSATPETGLPAGRMSDEPRGGARYDYGSVSGPVSGSGFSGYGSGRRETP